MLGCPPDAHPRHRLQDAQLVAPESPCPPTAGAQQPRSRGAGGGKSAPLSRETGGGNGAAGGLPAGAPPGLRFEGPRASPWRGERGRGSRWGREGWARGNPGAGSGPGRTGGRASGHYLLPKAPLRRRRVHPGPGPRGAGSDSRAAGRAPRAPRPNRGNRWPGRSRWSVAWSVPRRGPGPEPRGPLGPVSGAAVAAARAFRAPPPPLPSCSEAPGGPRDAAARDPGSGCPRRACSKTLFPRDREGVEPAGIGRGRLQDKVRGTMAAQFAGPGSPRRLQRH